MDRSDWFWGKTKINILTLAVAYEGAAIPLFWCLLTHLTQRVVFEAP